MNQTTGSASHASLCEISKGILGVTLILFLHRLSLSFRCLVKDYEQRPLVCELLSHPFIKQVNFYADEVRTDFASIC
jgi:hypothetical protein